MGFHVKFLALLPTGGFPLWGNLLSRKPLHRPLLADWSLAIQYSLQAQILCPRVYFHADLCLPLGPEFPEASI